MSDKKTVVIHTDYPLLKTGLGRNGREVANFLYKTGKYNIVYYCCGAQWNSPEFQRFPYKVVGALPDSIQEIEQLNKDPVQSRAASYGLYNIDRVIKEFKPDILITSNDSWASQSFLDKPWWNKIHCIPHITLDSLPFIPDQIKYLQNTKHFFVWADFAEKEAKRLGFNHVKTIPGIVDPKSFTKLLRLERQEIKKKFGLTNSFICGFVFRNQLRKEVKPLMEGFSIFLKDNPASNAYLLLHTNFSEAGGWDIPRFCEELNIDKSRILTTYICKHCNQYEIKSYAGQDLNCRFCNHEKTQITCNVINGVSEKQLNEVYGAMDCYCHLMNAGGLELPMVESLYCGLPLATVPYSCGETFTRNSFVFPIQFIYSVQHGTQFRRSVPQPTSVAKFLSKVYSMDEKERDVIGKQGREWAINTFSPESVGKQWEILIDSLPKCDWDYDFNVDKKNPDADISDIVDNEDDSFFIINLYKRILKMDVDKNDSGFQHWLKFLNPL